MGETKAPQSASKILVPGDSADVCPALKVHLLPTGSQTMSVRRRVLGVGRIRGAPLLARNLPVSQSLASKPLPAQSLRPAEGPGGDRLGHL